MSLKLYEETDIQNIADAIRGKNGLSDTYKVSQMASAVTAIPTGGGGNGSASKIIDRTITEYIDTENISRVGAYAFAGCSNLSKISFPNCLYVGDAAFEDCTVLSEANFPNCSSIASSAFIRCSGLINAYLPNCSVIGQNAFNRCTSLSSVVISNCTVLNGSAFNYCRALNYLDLPYCTRIYSNALEFVPLTNGISLPQCQFIYPSAFRATSMPTIDLPNCLSVYSWGFVEAKSLISFSASILSNIGTGAFWSCWLLSNFYAPNVTYLGNQCFANCSRLSAAYFPICSYVGSSAFSMCQKVSDITIAPMSIYSSAMYGCSGLSKLQLLAASVPTLGLNVFTNTPMSLSTYLGYYGSIYVPSSLVESYKSASNWSAFSNRITAIPE